MACKFFCDGCGKEESGRALNKKLKNGTVWWWWEKPKGWLQRGDIDLSDACSMECAARVNEKTGHNAPIEGKGT